MTPEDKEDAFLKKKDLEEERQNKLKNMPGRKHDILGKTSLVERPGQERHDTYKGPHLNSDSEEMHNYLNGLAASDTSLRSGSPEIIVLEPPPPSLLDRITGFLLNPGTATALTAVAAVAGFAVYKSR